MQWDPPRSTPSPPEKRVADVPEGSGDTPLSSLEMGIQLSLTADTSSSLRDEG